MTLTISNQGRIGGVGTLDANVNNTGTIFAQGGTYEVTGTIQPGVTLAVGALEIGVGGYLKLDGPVSGQTLTFLDNAGTVSIGQIASFSVTRIDGYVPGDKFLIQGQASLQQSYDANSGVLTILGPNNVVLDTMTFSGVHSAADFVGAIIGVAPCFAEGTRIRTADGEKPVETIVPGDVVRARFAGLARVVWVGHRRVDCRRHPKPEDVCPVRVVAGAFGRGLPRRDLVLSPDHAVFVDGVLVPVRYLLNGATIRQETVEEVTYWHVELESHDVMLAEGQPCESYLDTGNRGAFANGGGAVQLHPDFARGTWETKACAPLVLEGAALTAIRTRLIGRAQAMGFSLTDDPGLRLEVAGREVAPRLVAGGLYRFVVPGGTAEIGIVSRASSPADVSAVTSDRRPLGVMLEHVVLRDRQHRHRVALAALAEAAGFHALERVEDRAWRWTDGRARLSVPAGFGEGRDFVVDLHVVAVQPTWVAPATTATGYSAAAARKGTGARVTRLGASVTA